MAVESRERHWTQDELDRRLGVLRAALLHFLRERHRLEWFTHRIRWRLSRQYIWPGTPEQREALLREAAAEDVSVEAFGEYLQKQQHSITEAIEHYNFAVRRFMEEERGVAISEFDQASREELQRRRITFQGVRDELRRLARELTAESPPQLIPELLSLRLAILTKEVRDEIFSGVGAQIADEAADADEKLTAAERDLLATTTELRLRCLDQYHVAHLLAKNHEEARRLMRFNDLMRSYQELARQERESTSSDPLRRQRVEVVREVLCKYIAFLEEIFPASKGTHERAAVLLRRAPTGAAPAEVE